MFEQINCTHNESYEHREYVVGEEMNKRTRDSLNVFVNIIVSCVVVSIYRA